MLGFGSIVKVIVRVSVRRAGRAVGLGGGGADRQEKVLLTLGVWAGGRIRVWHLSVYMYLLTHTHSDIYVVQKIVPLERTITVNKKGTYLTGL